MKKIFLIILILIFTTAQNTFCADNATLINPDGTYNQVRKESLLDKIKSFF